MADAKTAFSELFTGPRELVEGVEATLLQRRRLGGLGLAIGLLGAVLQVILGLVDRDYFKKLTELAKQVKVKSWHEVLAHADRTDLIGMIGLVLFALGLLVYLLLRWTRVLQKESEEPFRYTVSLDPFKNQLKRDATTPPEDEILKNQDRLELLYLDLRERLNARIGRFSLLENRPATPPGTTDSATTGNHGSRRSTSHFHITGEYVLRERNKNWFIHVMPMVQLGGQGSPMTMAYPVWYDLGPAKSQTLDSIRYEQIVERVYSSVATEVYRQIEIDVRVKIEWFPTRYLRAVALFHEALDMARSNTVDAYDRALDLYRSAQRFFDLALLRDWRRWLVKMPLIWRMNARYLQTRARVQIGHVRCQIYRQMTALQTGRKPNAIYECIWRMGEVIEDLRVVHARFIDCDPKQPTVKSQVLGYFIFRRDRFVRAFMRRPLEPDYLRQRRILFDAYTVAAMAHALLGNIKHARERLDAAVAVDPSLRERDPVHLLAEAEISPDLRRRVKLLREATDLSPSFQIAQYRLAQTVDLLFRDENQLNPERVTNVIGQYDEVLRINPGNIAAIASKGYLYWLTSQTKDQLKNAEQCFREGIEFKSIVRETSIAELTYGLARTLVEQGEYDKAFDQFMQSVAIDPDVAAWTIGSESQSRTQTRYYTRISEAMVRRYVAYAQGIEDALLNQARERFFRVIQRRFEQLSSLAHTEALLPDSIQYAVISFVINDLANAYLNDYFRRGDPGSLTRAKEALEKIAKSNPDNPVVHFNLAVAREWENDFGEALRSIDRAVKLSPEWQAARVKEIDNTLSPGYLDALKTEVGKKEEELQAKKVLALQALKKEEEALQALKKEIRKKGEELRQLETSPPSPLKARMQTEKDTRADPATIEVATKIERLNTELSGLKQQLKDKQGKPVLSQADSRSKAKGGTPDQAELPATARFDTEIAHRETELSGLKQQLKDQQGNYNSNLRDALRYLTSNSRLWHLLNPGSHEAPPAQWTDNALALGWKQPDGSDLQIDNDVVASKRTKWWRRFLDHDSAVLRWEQLDGSDVQALKSLADATTKSALKEQEDNWKALKSLADATTNSSVKEQEDNWKALKLEIDAVLSNPKKQNQNWQRLKTLADAITNGAGKKHEDLKSIISQIEQSRAYLRKCARLHLLLAKQFLPEDFDVCLSLTLIRDAQGKARSRLINDILARTVAFWLEEDSWHYFSLRWIDWVDPDKLVAVVERQLYSRSQASRRLTLVVDRLLAEIEASSGRLSGRKDELYSRGLEPVLQAAEICVKHSPSRSHFNYNLGRVWELKKDWSDAALYAALSFSAAQAGVADSDDLSYRRKLISANVRAHEKYADEVQEQGSSVEAFEAYLELARVDPSRRRSYDKLLPALAKLTSRTKRTDAAARVRELLREELDRDGITENRRRETQDLLRRVQIGSSFGSSGLQRRHVVTPIAIEVASNLVDLVAKGESELQPELEVEATALRDRLRLAMGVPVPGLRFRGNEGDLPAGSYIIMLSEIPLVMGTINVEERFYQGSLDAPTITRVHAREQAEPLTNSTGLWLPEREVRSLGLKSDLVVHPRTFMMRHVEAVLLHNLAEFLGHSELNWMIEGLTLPQPPEPPTQRTALVSALRSLLLERVPIAALADIATVWPSVRATHPHLRAQVEALRSLPALRAQLPGNDSKHRLFEIGPKFESEIRNNLHNPDRVPVLGLRPELCQDMLATVRQALPSDPRDTPAALIVKDAPLRPHLRELVKLEWPSVPVLAVAELGSEAMASLRCRIELE